MGLDEAISVTEGRRASEEKSSDKIGTITMTGLSLYGSMYQNTQALRHELAQKRYPEHRRVF
jgi:hypothetical protein